MTPGVLTDVLGLSLLIPPLRSLIRRGLTHWLARRGKISAQGMWEEVKVKRDAEDQVIDAKVVNSRVVEE